MIGWVLFLRTESHRAVWIYALLPDQLARDWFGGDFARFGFSARVPVFAMAALVLAAAWGLGNTLITLCRTRDQWRPVERLVVSTGLGLGLVTVVTLLAGLAGWIQHTWLAYVVLALCLGGGIASELRGRTRMIAAEREPWLPDGLCWFAAISVAFFSLAILLGAVVPPNDFDVREYHLQVPKEWYQQGQITFLPHNVYGNMPLGSETLALLSMWLWPAQDAWWWGALTGKVLMAAFSVLTALLLLLAGRRFWNIHVGWVAALLYLTTPWIAKVSMAGLNDGVLAFYTACCWFLLAIGLAPQADAESNEVGAKSKQRMASWFLLAGVAAGCAMGVKYTGVVLTFFPALAVVIVIGVRKRQLVAITFLLAAVIVAAPWYLKNVALAGNPVYPLMGSTLGGATRDQEKTEQWDQAHAVPVDDAGRRYPLHSLLTSIDQLTTSDPWINPMLAALVATAVVLNYRDRRTWWLLAIAFYLFVVWWTATHRIPRFWLPMWPLLALLGATAVSRCSSTEHKNSEPESDDTPSPSSTDDQVWRRAVAVLLIPLVLYGVFSMTSRYSGDTRYFVGLAELRTDESHPADPEFSRLNPLHRWLNQQANGAGVLLVGDAQPFDLEPPVHYNTCFDECLFEQWTREKTASECLAEFEEREIRFVLIDWAEIGRYLSPGNYGFTDYVTLDRVEQLVDQGVLIQVALPFDAGFRQLFRVAGTDALMQPAR